MMQAETQAERAFDQVVEWLEHFEPLEDPRQAGKVWYRLDEVLLLCLVAVLAAAESWVEIAEFGSFNQHAVFRSIRSASVTLPQRGEQLPSLHFCGPGSPCPVFQLRGLRPSPSPCDSRSDRRMSLEF